MVDFETSISKYSVWGLEIKFVENYVFLYNYGTSHNVLYHQLLPIRFYANNYFELLPVVSTAFVQTYSVCFFFLHFLFLAVILQKETQAWSSWFVIEESYWTISSAW